MIKTTPIYYMLFLWDWQGLKIEQMDMMGKESFCQVNENVVEENASYNPFYSFDLF